jgi:hypothetical protein
MAVDPAKGKHPIDAGKRFDSPALQGVKQDLCIRSGSKAEALAFELIPQHPVVIDLTVENEGISFVFEGLVRPGVEVDDGEPVKKDGAVPLLCRTEFFVV